MYNVTGLGPADRAAHERALFLVPRTRATRRGARVGPPDGFGAHIALPGGRLAVPRFYGARHFGAPGDDRATEGAPARLAFVGELLPYQADATEACHAALVTGNGAMLCAGCGTGKTVMAICLAARLGRRTAILVHKQFLATQWAARIAEFAPGATVAHVQGAQEWDSTADVIVCMIQTVVSRYPAPTRAFDGVGFLIVDECHHVVAKTFSRSIMAFPARWRLGLTATPDRQDGLGFVLAWHLGPIVARVKRAFPDVRVVWFTGDLTLRPVRDRRGETLHSATVERLVGSEGRNQRILRCIKAGLDHGRFIIVISERRMHLESLCAAAAGIPGADPALYLGETSKRRKTERDARAQVANPLCASYAMGEEALDIPHLDMIILASPRGSPACIEQCVGRILRPYPGKPTPLVVDFTDSVCVGMAKSRRDLYRREGFTIEAGTRPADLLSRGDFFSRPTT
jgi:superfamily II DNA or RNA helicase